MTCFLTCAFFLGLVQQTYTAIYRVKGYECQEGKQPGLAINGHWEENANVLNGINIAFLVHREKLGSAEFDMISSVVEGILEYVRNKYSGVSESYYSLGLCTFSRNVDITFPLGWSKENTLQRTHIDDFLEEFRNMSHDNSGANISGAFVMSQQFFSLHKGNRIFAPNLCILLTTAPPDNQSLARASAKTLQDIGVSIIVIAVGDDVEHDDVKELASNENVVLTAPLNISTSGGGNYTELFSQSVTTTLKNASVLPRFSMCYQSYIDFGIIVGISENHVQMIAQLDDFLTQFTLKYMTMRVMIIGSPATEEMFTKKYKEMVNRNQGIQFEVHNTMINMSSSIDLMLEHFAHKLPNRKTSENIMIIVTDRISVDVDDIISGARMCKDSGIHVMALGVGNKILETQLAKIISDPTGIIMVTNTEAIFWGLQSLYRKLCPAICDRHWKRHGEMCYQYRNTFMISWIDAKAECKDFNGRLVSITSRDTLEWLTSTFSRESFPIYIGLRKYSKGSAPINSAIKWENGKPLVMTNWSTDGMVPQPDGGMYEQCVAWYPDGWRDVGCSKSIVSAGWLCERESNSASKPNISGVFVPPLSVEDACRMPWFMSALLPETILFKRDNCPPLLDVYTSTVYPKHAYNCTNGEMISKYLLCDGVNHCRDGSDEVGCAAECMKSQFQCDNSRCVSLAYVCDFWDDCGDNSDEVHCVHPECAGKWTCDSGQCTDNSARCNLYYDCYDRSDENNCGDRCVQTQCDDGTCIPNSWKSDGQVDCSGGTKEDETEGLGDICYEGKYRELYNLFTGSKYKQERPECSMVFDGFGKHFDSYSAQTCLKSTICPVGFYMCPASYCIPLDRVCDGTMDCVDGEDEMGCSEYTCPGYFRCPGASYCLHPSRLCDGEVDCPGGKDEVMCNFKCPDNCKCFGGLVECEQSNNTSPFPPSTRILVLTEQTAVVQETILFGLIYLTEAVLSKIGLETTFGIFKDQENLLTLNISRNKIRNIPEYSLLQLRNLKVLDLSFNKLESISEMSFAGLSKLKELHLRNSLLKILRERSFSPLVSLEVIDLTGNKIHSVHDDAFIGLSSVRSLYLKDNVIENFGQGIYDGLERVEEIHTDVFTLCCSEVRPLSVKESKCISPKASISSCNDLMSNDFLRASIWILCISSLFGNILSTLMRMVWEKGSMKIGFGVFVTHLGISDFLMGVYLFIIAIADTKYKGMYIWEDHKWRISPYCKMAGFMATLSSEASAMFIFLITLDRFLVMKFPFGQVRFRFRSATVSSIIAWIVAFVMSGIPLLPSFAHWEFYSKNGACLALPFFTEREPGWVYSVSIFIGFNFFVFMLIAVGQYIIYRTMKQGSMISTKGRMAKEMAVARRLLLIVSTDFFCWFPIGVMGLLALSGKTIGGDVYAWAAVFVLPVNSALNPFLYTIPTVLQKLRTADAKARNAKENPSELTNIKSVIPDQESKVVVKVGDLDPNSNMVLLEEFLLQFKSHKDKKRILQTVLTCLDDNSLYKASNQSKPTIYVNLQEKEVETICVTTSPDHRAGDLTTSLLSLLGVGQDSVNQH